MNVLWVCLLFFCIATFCFKLEKDCFHAAMNFAINGGLACLLLEEQTVVTAHTKILAVDENPEAWAEIISCLSKSGYDLLVTDNAEKAFSLLQDGSFKLVIVDSDVPDIDYLELIRQIKSICALPLITVSGDNDVINTVVALEVGADDFVGKPFETLELAARIKAHLRLVHDVEEKILENVEASAEKKDDHLISFGYWILDRNKMQVVRKKDRNPVDLTAGEYQLLEALVVSSGKVLSRERLFELTRHEKFEAYDRAVDTQIARIRKKLMDDSKNPKFIKTVRGTGYMLDIEAEKTG